MNFPNLFQAFLLKGAKQTRGERKIKARGKRKEQK